MGLSEQTRDAGQEIIGASSATFPDVLNHQLAQLIGWPFNVTSGCVVDAEGERTESFASVVYAAPEDDATSETGAIPADCAAAVLDALDTLDLESFRTSYERIAQTKRLKKRTLPSFQGSPITTITLGLILAQRAAVPLEVIAEELERLNSQAPSREWPDMVVVASTGVINYAVQLPGEPLSGDFLPPAAGALKRYIPPLYIVIVMRPTRAYTFNKMAAFLVAHLAIFSPGARLPDSSEILEGVSPQVVIMSGYQYNLKGELVPVPRELYNDRHLPAPPLRIEDPDGNLLSTVQFVPWQDGGVIILRGRLPLEALLLFLGKDALQRGGVKRPPDTQMSNVLPITRENFNAMLNKFQRQSNMVVRSDQTKLIIQKIGDEGTRSPIIARLQLGILRLRDVIYHEAAARKRFDALYEVVLSSVFSARSTAKQITKLWDEHAAQVAAGEVAHMQGRTIQIDENIDKPLREGVESFLNAAVRALKQGMQNLAAELGVSIGFLFQQEGAFAAGIVALAATDPALAEYLRQTRTWSEGLIGRRNAIEHEGWMLPRVAYSHDDVAIRAEEPLISDEPLTVFVRFILDRLLCLAEELTAHCLQARMPPGITITEIARAERVPEAPERFRVTLVNGGLPAWQIAFHTSLFEDT